MPSPEVLACLSRGAEDADRRHEWVTRSWNVLREAGILGWAVPMEYGGAGLDPVGLHRANESLGSACLTTVFALSQRDAAIRLLLSGPSHLRERYLPGLAAGDLFMTVGLSQLTTSRAGSSALRAERTGSGFRLEGTVPWITGADQAEAIVVGATLADGQQVLVALPRRTAGVTVDPPLELAALQGSRTSSLHCRQVEVDAEHVVAGPKEQVLGRSVGGGLDTSCLGLALASAAIGEIRRQTELRPKLHDLVNRFEASLTSARQRLHELATNPSEPQDVWELRIAATRLALRSTQAALTVAKGTGFVAGQAAQRWARQALFFLVWSCPKGVADAILADLSP